MFLSSEHAELINPLISHHFKGLKSSMRWRNQIIKSQRQTELELVDASENEQDLAIQTFNSKVEDLKFMWGRMRMNQNS